MRQTIPKTHITGFIFHKAEYLIQDAEGSQILLKINYKNNSFLLKIIKSEKGVYLFQKTASLLARNLLKRKHNKNFACKIVKIKLKP